nr:gastrula zinc finger protein XlCGF26.1 [Aedes albopictus]
MDRILENPTCRVCLSAADPSRPMWPLFESFWQQKTPADIIQYCFGVEVSKSSAANRDRICSNCKTDLDAALRFVTQLKASVETLDTVTPKDESGLFHENSEVCITEIEIKTESSEEYIEEENKIEIIECIEEVHPKRRKPRKRLEVTHLQSQEKLQEHTEPNPTPPHIPTKTEASSSSEEEDHNEDNDYDQNLTSGEDPDYDESDKPPAKRAYTKPTNIPKRCCSCKEPLDSHEKVQKHSDQYHLNSRITNPKEYGDRLFECSVCYERFDTKILYLRHQRKMYVDELHPCPRCEEDFANLFVLKQHIKFEHKKQLKFAQMEEMRSKANLCCGCTKQFPTADALKEHVEKTHARERVFYDTSKTFECGICYNRFKTCKSLKHHQVRFFKEKKFVCTLCGKSFREKMRLAEHENLHRKIAPFQCVHCPARFAIKNSFEVHVKMHDAEEIYNCEYCGKGFRKKSLLMGHLQIHDTDRPFKCHLCPITFTRQNLLDAHLLGHSGLKPHKCTQCAASYIHQRDLRRHIREKHEGIRSFKCNLCPKAYIRHKLLEAHLKTHNDD